jgi:alkanesulfonate monooxygenase SsuD/methylene tetrahydromethanopterin reductase-like flavin-dependent oxidoreductase (luciferase family)
VLQFGIFDHLDDNGTPFGTMLEHRLKLVEQMDQDGFYAYQFAEHHSTPLGLAPSPSVLIAAAIQRTKRIKLGPLVYVLPMYHPIRLYEEICMLDHMSNGRLLLGVGRGATLFEHERFGVDAAQSPAMYHEAYAVLMRAFETDVLNFEGKFYNYKDYLLQAKPVQRPHPPIWYGAPFPDAVGWAAPNSINVVSLGSNDLARQISDRYRKEWAALGRKPADLPMIGMTRHVVVAETDAAAQKIARRAYPRWRDAMEFLWLRSNVPFPIGFIYPKDYDGLDQLGHGVAGSPATVRDHMEKLHAEAGVNYVLCQMAFGDITYDEAAHSMRLFAREVMPAFAKSPAKCLKPAGFS